MLSLQEINRETLPALRLLTRACPYLSCEFSPGMLAMWQEDYPVRFAVTADCLTVEETIEGEIYFSYPYPINENGNVEAALAEIESHCGNRSIPLRFWLIPEEEVGKTASRYAHIRLDCIRELHEYLYLTEDLASLAGRHYHSHRNHIAQFLSSHPDALFRELTPADAPLLESFWREYRETADLTLPRARQELAMAVRAVRCDTADPDRCGGVFADGRLVGVCYCEIFGQSLLIHVEKCLPSYRDAYHFIVKSEVNAFGGSTVYVNREDDALDPGLRFSKLSYRPVRLLRTYSAAVKNELDGIDPADFPNGILAEGEGGLSLTFLHDEDRDAYDALCLNEQHNRYWGYDYKEDNPHPQAGYFLSSAREDFARGINFSMALRLGETFIGEVVLWNFDGRGNAEIGLRLLPPYCGKGYSVPAYETAGNFALYTLGIATLRARVFKENAPGRRALAHSFRESGEDETYLYLERHI